MGNDMDEKFKEAFILFSSCDESMPLCQFYELMHSFGILLNAEEKAELPEIVNMEFWLNFARKHYNYEEPFKHISSLSDKSSSVQIKINNFVDALDTRLTDKDLELLLEIANPDKKDAIDLNTISKRLTNVV
ncbi:conserved Plasmodium protein, unknown function [Plasmodium malariae]|uniref:Myosin essential light chain ELC n=1 Tax=Plasmodium malariae TaxID=5858 RepID=A0A1C3K9G0_PLAMA|nr:conserved Plasmodium protein, unknown function [Plasmodium malariae]